MWAALKLRMELTSNHEWMIFDLDDLHESSCRPLTGEHETFVFEFLAEVIVELITMTVALADLSGTVCGVGLRALLELALELSQTQRSSHATTFVLIWQEVHDVFVVTKCLFLIKFLTCELRVLQHRTSEFDGEQL